MAETTKQLANEIKMLTGPFKKVQKCLFFWSWQFEFHIYFPLVQLFSTSCIFHLQKIT